MTATLKVSVPSDTSEIQRISAAAARVDGAPPLSDQALLALRQGKREAVVFELPNANGAAAQAVAFAVFGEGELDLAVDPAQRGQGFGTTALALALPHAKQASPDGGVLAWNHGDSDEAAKLFQDFGFEPIRTLYRFELPVSALPQVGAISDLQELLPEGFVLSTIDTSANDTSAFNTGGGDAAEWVRVNAAAFSDHPEQGRMTLDDLQMLFAEDWFDPADLLLARQESGDRALAGFTWIKTLRGEEGTDTTECELYVLAVDPQFGGRGLGRALLDVTLARMAEHRPTKVTLYVDDSNERAVELYRKNGFVEELVSRQWRNQ